MNPAHRGHAALLVSAREQLRSQGWDVVRAILSPSHDDYLRWKYGVRTLRCPREHRLELARRMLSEAPDAADIEVGEWESGPQHHRWPDFPEVIEHYRAEAVEVLGPDATVYYACGEDHARYCQGVAHLAVVPRAVAAEGAPPRPDGLSSTAVRAALRRGDLRAVTEALGAAATRYIEAHQLRFDGPA
jgi:nicotinic acid mononucleotide adenylyltransferase